MKQFIVSIFVLFIFATALNAVPRFMKNSPIGFRGVKWGDPPSVLGHSLQIGDGFYIRDEDKLLIGNARLSSIVYEFWKNRFYAVMIEAPRGQFTHLKAAMISQFGPPPYRTSRSLDEFAWSDSNATITLVEYGESGNSELSIVSMSINDLRNSDMRNKKTTPPTGGF